LDLAAVEEAFALLPRNITDITRGNADSIFDITSHRPAEIVAVFRHAGRELQLKHT
jgi:hypothetical protein